MKKALLILCVLMCNFYSGFAHADPSAKIYIDPSVAQTVIPKYFSHIISEYATNDETETDDETVLLNVTDAYNDMLKENDGFASVNGIINVCVTGFNDVIQYIQISVFINTCTAFIKDLIHAQPVQKTDTGCPYTNISKVNNSQTKIKYTLPNNSGFIRNGGSIAWRFFNPGNLRGSNLQCTTIRTKPNGVFAVFPNAEVGKLALHKLLTENNGYRNSTVKKAIYTYAPPSQNNSAGYVRKLQNAGINVNKKISELTDAELEKLEKLIMTIEGWGQTGTETQF